MKIYLVSLATLVVILLNGCAVQNDKTKIHGLGLTYSSNVQQLSNGDYFTEVEASLASGRITTAVELANKNAVEFCKEQNKTMEQVISETNSHLLVNGTARLTFRCL
ncbi:hypothetical protein DES39_0348 [Orbus hercynius]|uniref:Lipoprotein n=1 Tax=Orbus hercynius TaxID=593135 RepID=A0A495RHX8_9GAMM|nr:hypothetical protein [Orbus hercynius]RKS87133.1 hypothetical protein DES39_0348 [Orbus hercynius]